MTAVVGILCSDGVVVGTDSSVTMGSGTFRTIEQPTEKLDVVDNRAIIAGTGSVGHGQRFRNVVENALHNKQFVAELNGVRQKPVDICRNISSATITDFRQTFTPPDAYSALLAVPVGREQVLCEFANGFQPTLYTDQMWFGSMGSKQPITDPFLALMREIFWPTGQPTVQEATLAVTWTLDHAIAVNPGGVNGPARIAVLEPNKNSSQSRLLSDEDLNEHRSWIQDAKRHLSDRLRATADVETPPIP
jgi:hypothetical protein